MAEITPQELNKILQTYFSLGEIRSLAFDLNIPYDDLGGSTRALKTIELVQYAERHGRTNDLIAYIRSARPNANLGAALMQKEGVPPAQEPKGAAPTHVTYNFNAPVTGAAIGEGATLHAENIAGRDIIIGQVPETREAFQEQLAALEALLKEALANNEIPDERDAQLVQSDLANVTAETAQEQPNGNRMKRWLEGIADVVGSAGKVAQAAGKTGTAVLKAAPIIATLLKAAQAIF